LSVLAIGGVVASLLLLLLPQKPLKRELVVATDHSPPFQIVNPDGSVTGVTIEAINLAAAHAGIQLSWMPVTVRPDDVLGDLDSGVDLWPMVTAYPGRNERFHLTQPIGRAEYIIAVIDDDRFNGDRLKLKVYQPDRIAVTRGPWTAEKLKKDFPNSEAVYVNPGKQMQALCDGQADALIADAASVYTMTLQMPASCAGKRILDRLMEGWYWDLSIGSTFARSAEADRIRAEFGRLARQGDLHAIFADYPIQAQYRSEDTFAETRTEREARLTRAILISLAVCSLALFGIVLETRRRAAAVVRLARLKSSLVDRISHELRTPLNGVLGLASLLAATPLNEAQKEYLDLIRQSGEQLLKLINDSLQLSRLESGHQRRVQEVVPVRPHMEETVSLLAPMAHRRDLDLEWVVAREVPVAVVADGGVLRQLLINLGGNAVKYSEQGRVSIAVSIAGLDSGFPFLQFEVDDSGPGIPEEDRARIFESFVRLDRPLDQTTVGSGLGLSISRELVTLYGGRIGVKAGRFGGACFWFQVPVELPAGSETSPTESAGDFLPDAATTTETARAGTSQGNGPEPSQRPVALLLKVQCRSEPATAGGLDKLAFATRSATPPDTDLDAKDLNAKGIVRRFSERGAPESVGRLPRAEARAAAPVSKSGGPVPAPGDATSDTLEMAGQYLEAEGYACRSLVIADARGLRQRMPEVPQFLVLDYAAGGEDLHELIHQIRSAFEAPTLPAVVFCTTAWRAQPCALLRPPAVRVLRVPFLSNSFQRTLAAAQAEAAEPADGSDLPKPCSGSELVPCSLPDCPMGKAALSLKAPSSTSDLANIAAASPAVPCIANSPEAAKPAQGLLANARVLVADDNSVNRLVLCAMLRAMGAYCDEAVDGADALRVCESGRYDLLIVDHHMPYMDGLAVTGVLRKQNDWRRTVPIIAASAADTSTQQARYRDVAVDAVLSKPFSRKELTEALQSIGWLNGRNAAPEESSRIIQAH
jgi:signal transduction histidine kinase/CheY-like chemotaxis protein